MATRKIFGPGYYASERYAPKYWLVLCEEARTGGEYEVAIGYAHLALLLCQHICNTFHSKASERLPQTHLDNSVWIQMSTYDHDPKNLAENEAVLYFEGLKLIACRNIVADLLVLGLYAEAQAMTEFIITPTNWLVDVAEEERFKLAAALEDFVTPGMAKSQREQGNTYLRHNTKLWKNPFDIDTSTKEGVDRLTNFIFHSRTKINPDQPLPSDQIRKSIGFMRHPRNGHKPCLMSLKKFQKKDAIWIDGTFLGVTSDQPDACECCLVVEAEHPADPEKSPKKCCEYISERVWPSCWQQAKEWYHTHSVDTKEFWEQNDAFDEVIAESKVEDFGHALPLIQRLINLVRVASVKERIHPLQYDIIPFLPSDCRRLVPWSYKRGIVDVVDLLIMEGIDPFVEDFWSIRSILILWRKFGPIDFHLIAQDGTTSSDGEMLLANFSCVFPIYPFLMHSCEPNARVYITPDAPTRLRLVAVKQIEPGEPITISRIQYDHQANKAMPLNKRRKAFEALGVYPCQCELCTRELMENIQLKRKAPGAPTGDAKFKDADSQTYTKMLESRSKAIQVALDAMKQKYSTTEITAEEKEKDASGQLTTEEEHSTTEITAEAKEKDASGKLTTEEEHSTTEITAEEKEKDASGKLTTEGEYSNTEITAEEKEKDASGQLTTEEHSNAEKSTPPASLRKKPAKRKAAGGRRKTPKRKRKNSSRQVTPKEEQRASSRRKQKNPSRQVTPKEEQRASSRRKRKNPSRQATPKEEQRSSRKRKREMMVLIDNSEMLDQVVAEYYRLREQSFEELTKEKRQRRKLPKHTSEMSADEIEELPKPVPTPQAGSPRGTSPARDTEPTGEVSMDELEGPVPDSVPKRARSSRRSSRRASQPGSDRKAGWKWI